MRVRVLFPFVVVAMLAVPAAASASFAHTVAPGESLYSIAAADGLSVDQLAAANGLSSASQLVAGSTVQIPPQLSGAAQTAAGPTSASVGDGDGDSDDVPVGDGDADSDDAGASSGSSALPVSTSAASSQPVGSAAEGSPTNPPYPTPERVTSSQVGEIAAANGVSPSLAAAVAWQESGFNNALVSSADARGVMQILPGTWDWIQRTLAGGTTLAPASAADNVRGGVLLLHSLLNSTGGDPAMAAAGYYQGLPSLLRHGVLPETQQYVNSVLALRQRFGGP
jgi:N-acetylmuramoyl-L-alanine amidase